MKGLVIYKTKRGYQRVGMFHIEGVPLGYFDDCVEQDIIFTDGEGKSQTLAA
jgi:hypothetical protein